MHDVSQNIFRHRVIGSDVSSPVMNLSFKFKNMEHHIRGKIVHYNGHSNVDL